MAQFTNLLAKPLRWVVLIALIALTNTAFAQKQFFPSAEAALVAIFPNKKTWVWAEEEGDLNGDGMKDLVIVVRAETKHEATHNRLVVLTGVTGGKYSVLSLSSVFCPAQKFYNLSIEKASVYVQAVHRVDADNIVTDSLQFRFNEKLADFELIGRENQWGLDQDGSSSGLSVNYITGKSTSYVRVKERTKSQKTTHFKVLPFIRLNGFKCDRDLPNKP